MEKEYVYAHPFASDLDRRIVLASGVAGDRVALQETIPDDAS